MIIGLFLRNYKTYEKYNFIPFINENSLHFNLFIGGNGVGKSSILEALDTFFNGREFNVNLNARKRDASLAPVFLVSKEKFKETLKQAKDKEFVEKLSNLMWDLDLSSLYASNKEMRKFNDLRQNLKNKNFQDTHFLFFLGLDAISKEINVLGAQKMIRDAFKKDHFIENDEFKKGLNSLKTNVLSHYKYIYIPVETSIEEFLKLEAKGMQALMNQDLKDEVEGILKNKFEIDGTGEKRRTKRSVELIKFINEKISEYVDSIENIIQNIDNKYHFNQGARSKSISVKDISKVIIENYFTKRNLQLENKDISYLSAGERKKALIDIAYAFIRQEGRIDNEIILGIDEPESSLHISMCYDQFKRIEEIANKYHKQVFVTSHWYGGIPILQNGNLFSVIKNEDNLPSVEMFSLDNYFEKRGDHPNDINLKSFYDLTSSIVSSIRNSEEKWIIVEGLTDKKYLDHYLGENHNYKILPVGGCTIVKKIYEYLYLPLSQDELNETDKKYGSVFCLIDTDPKTISLTTPSETKNKLLKIRRLQIIDSKVELFNLNSDSMNYNTSTEVEEILNPKKFYQAITKTIEEKELEFGQREGCENLTETFNCYNLDDNAVVSRVSGAETMLTPNIARPSMSADYKLFSDFIACYKKQICRNYICQSVQDKPEWVKKIEDLMQ